MAAVAVTGFSPAVSWRPPFGSEEVHSAFMARRPTNGILHASRAFRNRRRHTTLEPQDRRHDELHRLERRVAELETKVARLEAQDIAQKLDQLLKGQRKLMATLDETLAKVTEEDTDIDSIIAFLAGIKQQLADALSGASLPAPVQAKVDQIFSQATSSAQKIVTALDTNVEPTP